MSFYSPHSPKVQWGQGFEDLLSQLMQMLMISKMFPGQQQGQQGLGQPGQINPQMQPMFGQGPSPGGPPGGGPPGISPRGGQSPPQQMPQMPQMPPRGQISPQMLQQQEIMKRLEEMQRQEMLRRQMMQQQFSLR